MTSAFIIARQNKRQHTHYEMNGQRVPDFNIQSTHTNKQADTGEQEEENATVKKNDCEIREAVHGSCFSVRVPASFFFIFLLWFILWCCICFVK